MIKRGAKMDIRFEKATETDVYKQRNHYFYKKCGFQVTETSMDGNVKVAYFIRKK